MFVFHKKTPRKTEEPEGSFGKRHFHLMQLLLLQVVFIRSSEQAFASIALLLTSSSQEQIYDKAIF